MHDYTGRGICKTERLLVISALHTACPRSPHTLCSLLSLFCFCKLFLVQRLPTPAVFCQWALAHPWCAFLNLGNQ